MPQRPLATIIAFGLALGLVGGCSRGKGKAQAGPKAALVTVEAATRESAPVLIEAVGHVEAIESVAVRAQVGGAVTGVAFREGQDVQRGQLLFQLDDRPFKASLAQAEAVLARDKAQARRAAEQLRRYTALYRDGGVSQDQFDQFRTAASTFDATVAADQAAVDQARVQLGYASIRAPINGRVGRRTLTQGNVVRPNDVEPLLVIHQLSPIEVSFAVPEAELAAIRRQQAKGALTVAARIDGDAGAPMTGTLSFIDNAVDPTTGTITLKGRFTNADKRLWPGQFVRTTLTVDVQPGAILVPAHAVQTGQQGAFVVVVGSDATATIRPVTVARTLGERAVIAAGLEAGETVVTDGHMQVVPGGAVKITGARGSDQAAQVGARPEAGMRP